MSLKNKTRAGPKAHKVSLKDKTRAGVRPSDRASTFSNIDVCETSGSIAIIFLFEASLGLGKGCIRFKAKSD